MRAHLKLDTVENLWDKRLNYTVQKAIKQAEESRLTIKRGASENTLKEEFYPLYLRQIKRFGTPPQSLKYFFSLLGKLEIKLFWAEFKNETIAAVLGWGEGKNMVVVYNPSNMEYWHLRANDLLHWELIKEAVKDGVYEYVDFGPVRYEGQLQYKKKWGCEIYEDNEKRINPDLWFYRIFRFFWRTFVPLKLTPYFGKLFRK